MILMKKKGDVNWQGISLILALVVFFTLLFLFKKPAAYAGQTFSSTTLHAIDQKCKLDTQRAREEGKNPLDLDKDERADFCDICTNGNNDDDKDDDGIPIYCDKDDNPTSGRSVGCKFSWTDDGKCIEGAISR